MALSRSADRGRMSPAAAALAAMPVAVVLAVSEALVRAVGLKRSVRIAWWFADRVPAPRPLALPPREIAAKQSRMILRVAENMPFLPRCLARSLVLAATPRRRGIAADLCLGAKIAPPFDAHAWIEVDGEPVNEAPDLLTNFSRLWRLPTLPA